MIDFELSAFGGVVETMLPAEGIAPGVDGVEGVTEDEDCFEGWPIVAEVVEIVEEWHGCFDADGEWFGWIYFDGDESAGGAGVEGVGGELMRVVGVDFVVDFVFGSCGAGGFVEESFEEGGGVGEFETFAGDLVGFVGDDDVWFGVEEGAEE